MIDIPLLEREFYDKQDPERPDVLLDFDLIYPEGYEEAISGGEREHEYEQILKRMELKKTPPEQFKDYLEVAKAGILRHSAGCGIGIERFTRWILALDHVEKTRLFAKTQENTLYKLLKRTFDLKVRLFYSARSTSIFNFHYYII